MQSQCQFPEWGKKFLMGGGLDFQWNRQGFVAFVGPEVVFVGVIVSAAGLALSAGTAGLGERLLDVALVDEGANQAFQRIGGDVKMVQNVFFCDILVCSYVTFQLQ
jgi:hypothetical protein